MSAHIVDLNTEVALKSAVFRDLPRDQVLPLIRDAKQREVERGSTIFYQGETAHSLFIILDGWVKLYRLSPCGVEAVVSVLSREDAFGEASAMPGEVYSTGAEAVADSHIMQIDAQSLWSAIKENPQLCHALLGASVSRNRALVDQLEQLKSHTGAQRIADFLLGLCKTEHGACTVVLPYDKGLIASWLGLKPETLSRAFKRLQPYGVSISKNRATIKSVERLIRFAEEDPSSSRKDAPLKSSSFTQS